MKQEYKLLIEVELNKTDDEEEAKTQFPKDPLHLALVKLYASELQNAYDELCLSGHFQIKQIELDGKIHIIGDKK
jgi:hypothetical protein